MKYLLKYQFKAYKYEVWCDWGALEATVNGDYAYEDKIRMFSSKKECDEAYNKLIETNNNVKKSFIKELEEDKIHPIRDFKDEVNVEDLELEYRNIEVYKCTQI